MWGGKLPNYEPGLFSNTHMFGVYTRQQLNMVTAEFERRDAYVRGLVPVAIVDYDPWYHEADIRALYLCCAIAYENPRRERLQGECGVKLYDMRILMAGVLVATHRAKVLTCPMGLTYAIAIATPEYVQPVAPTPVAPEPSPELAAVRDA